MKLTENKQCYQKPFLLTDTTNQDLPQNLCKYQLSNDSGPLKSPVITHTAYLFPAP